MTGREILAALQCGKPNCACAKGKVTHCPAHDDKTPSLSITDDNGKALFYCHTGCDQSAVIAALKERGLWGSEARSPIPARNSRGGLTATYQYLGPDGAVLAEHGRFETSTGKTFAWRKAGGSWDAGLGELSTTDLPLYGVDLLDADQGTVWFVEGEKAAERARAAGLLAVCLGGGASQSTFGNALDPLRDRQVVLWPDNDEAGAAFMGKIATLLPQAKYVRPIVPPKGDAYDYFEGGGTVEALEALLETAAVYVSVVGMNALNVVMPVPAGRIHFEFSDLVSSPRSVDADMRMVVEIPGKRQTPYSTRVNLNSASAREGIRREIQGIYPGKDIEWAAVFAEACDAAKETWRGLDYSQDLSEIEEVTQRRWAVERFAPAGLPTILFGMGGGGKSFLAADLGLHCLYGMPWKGRLTEAVDGVLVVDYEDTIEEWRLRVQQLCDGYAWPFPEHGFRYLPGRAITLADQYSQLKEIIVRERIGLVIVDSAISAVGGDVIDSASPARLINALQSLGVTALIIAHSTKAEESKYPLGSIFWHNLVRATHYVESSQAEGSQTLEAAIHNRKGNRGIQRPIPVRITFPTDDAGPVTIDLLDKLPEHLMTEDQQQRWTILKVLLDAGRPMSVKELEDATAFSRASISGHLSRNKSLFTNVGRGMWAARAERDDGLS